MGYAGTRDDDDFPSANGGFEQTQPMQLAPTALDLYTVEERAYLEAMFKGSPALKKYFFRNLSLPAGDRYKRACEIADEDFRWGNEREHEQYSSKVMDLLITSEFGPSTSPNQLADDVSYGNFRGAMKANIDHQYTQQRAVAREVNDTLFMIELAEVVEKDIEEKVGIKDPDPKLVELALKMLVQGAGDGNQLLDYYQAFTVMRTREARIANDMLKLGYINGLAVDAQQPVTAFERQNLKYHTTEAYKLALRSMATREGYALMKDMALRALPALGVGMNSIQAILDGRGVENAHQRIDDSGQSVPPIIAASNGDDSTPHDDNAAPGKQVALGGNGSLAYLLGPLQGRGTLGK